MNKSAAKVANILANSSQTTTKSRDKAETRMKDQSDKKADLRLSVSEDQDDHEMASVAATNF